MLTNITKYSYRFALSLLMAAGLVAGTALAQTSTTTTATEPPTTAPPTTPPPGMERPQNEIKKFDQFLDKHPAIQQALAKNPAQLSNPSFVSQFPQLQKFLTKNPGLAQALTKNPTAVMSQVRKFDKLEANGKQPPSPVNRGTRQASLSSGMRVPARPMGAGIRPHR